MFNVKFIKVPVWALALTLPLGLVAGSLSVPNTFVADTPAVADDVNANFAAVEVAVNDNDMRVSGVVTDLDLVEVDVADHETRVSELENSRVIRTLTKILATDISTDGTISSISFFNLTPGEYYRISGQVALSGGDSASWGVVFKDGSSLIGRSIAAEFSAGPANFVQGINIVYQASGATMSVEAAGVSAPGTQSVVGNGSRNATFITLEHLPNHQLTSQW